MLKEMISDLDEIEDNLTNCEMEDLANKVHWIARSLRDLSDKLQEITL